MPSKASWGSLAQLKWDFLEKNLSAAHVFHSLLVGLKQALKG